MQSSVHLRSQSVALDLSELQQTLRHLMADQAFCEVFDYFADRLKRDEDQLWLQIDGELQTGTPLEAGNSEGIELTEWVVHSSFGELSESESAALPPGVNVHADVRPIGARGVQSTFPVGLCFQNATLTLSRSGSAVPDDRFVAAPMGLLSPLEEGCTLTAGGRVIGKVTQNSGGLCQLRFYADCDIDDIDTVLSGLAFFNARTRYGTEVLIDWSFCCYYLSQHHTLDEQVFVGSTQGAWRRSEHRRGASQLSSRSHSPQKGAIAPQRIRTFS